MGEAALTGGTEGSATGQKESPHFGIYKKERKKSPVNPFNCEILPVPCPVSCWTSVIRILYSSVIRKGSKERPCTLQVTRHLILGPEKS